jgi:hypothetical protein
MLLVLATLILLILLGLLGIASWLKSRQPKAGAPLGQLESIGGWVGVVGLVWGLVMLLQWLQSLSYLRFAPGSILIALVTVLIVIALSLILALPVLRSLFGSNNFTTRLGQFTGKLAPYKIGLGFACLVLALYTLILLAGVRVF